MNIGGYYEPKGRTPKYAYKKFYENLFKRGYENEEIIEMWNKENTGEFKDKSLKLTNLEAHYKNALKRENGIWLNNKERKELEKEANKKYPRGSKYPNRNIILDMSPRAILMRLRGNRQIQRGMEDFDESALNRSNEEIRRFNMINSRVREIEHNEQAHEIIGELVEKLSDVVRENSLLNTNYLENMQILQNLYTKLSRKNSLTIINKSYEKIKKHKIPIPKSFIIELKQRFT